MAAVALPNVSWKFWLSVSLIDNMVWLHGVPHGSGWINTRHVTCSWREIENGAGQRQQIRFSNGCVEVFKEDKNMMTFGIFVFVKNMVVFF